MPGSVVAAFGLSYAVIAPTEYTADAWVQVNTRALTNPIENTRGRPDGDDLGNVAGEIRNREVLEHTVLAIGPEELVEDSALPGTYLRERIKHMLGVDPSRPLTYAVRVLDDTFLSERFGRTAMRISYTGRNPEIAANVVNTLVKEFVGKTTDLELQSAQDKLTFIEAQLEKYREKLQLSESALRNFRQERQMALPDQFQKNLAELSQRESELVTVDINIQEAEKRIDLLEKQISQTSEQAVIGLVRGANPYVQNLFQDLANAKADLQEKLINYTEKHPDVIGLRQRIASLQEQIEAESNQSVTEETLGRNPQYDALLKEKSQAEITLQTLHLRRDAVQQQIDQLKSRSKTIPESEEELVRLTRDNSVNAGIYNSLLEKREEANIALTLVLENHSGKSFRIQELARADMPPSGPNRVVIIAFGLIFGVAVAAGGIFGRNFLDDSFDDMDQLIAAFDDEVPCLAIVPRLDTAS